MNRLPPQQILAQQIALLQSGGGSLGIYAYPDTSQQLFLNISNQSKFPTNTINATYINSLGKDNNSFLKSFIVILIKIIFQQKEKPQILQKLKCSIYCRTMDLTKVKNHPYQDMSNKNMKKLLVQFFQLMNYCKKGEKIESRLIKYPIVLDLLVLALRLILLTKNVQNSINYLAYLDPMETLTILSQFLHFQSKFFYGLYVFPQSGYFISTHDQEEFIYGHIKQSQLKNQSRKNSIQRWNQQLEQFNQWLLQDKQGKSDLKSSRSGNSSPRRKLQKKIPKISFGLSGDANVFVNDDFYFNYKKDQDDEINSPTFKVRDRKNSKVLRGLGDSRQYKQLDNFMEKMQSSNKTAQFIKKNSIQERFIQQTQSLGLQQHTGSKSNSKSNEKRSQQDNHMPQFGGQIRKRKQSRKRTDTGNFNDFFEQKIKDKQEKTKKQNKGITFNFNIIQFNYIPTKKNSKAYSYNQKRKIKSNSIKNSFNMKRSYGDFSAVEFQRKSQSKSNPKSLKSCSQSIGQRKSISQVQQQTKNLLQKLQLKKFNVRQSQNFKKYIDKIRVNNHQYNQNRKNQQLSENYNSNYNYNQNQNQNENQNQNQNEKQFRSKSYSLFQQTNYKDYNSKKQYSVHSPNYQQTIQEIEECDSPNIANQNHSKSKSKSKNNRFPEELQNSTWRPFFNNQDKIKQKSRSRGKIKTNIQIINNHQKQQKQIEKQQNLLKLNLKSIQSYNQSYKNNDNNKDQSYQHLTMTVNARLSGNQHNSDFNNHKKQFRFSPQKQIKQNQKQRQKQKLFSKNFNKTINNMNKNISNLNSFTISSPRNILLQSSKISQSLNYSQNNEFKSKFKQLGLKNIPLTSKNNTITTNHYTQMLKRFVNINNNTTQIKKNINMKNNNDNQETLSTQKIHMKTQSFYNDSNNQKKSNLMFVKEINLRRLQQQRQKQLKMGIEIEMPNSPKGKMNQKNNLSLSVKRQQNSNKSNNNINNNNFEIKSPNSFLNNKLALSTFKKPLLNNNKNNDINVNINKDYRYFNNIQSPSNKLTNTVHHYITNMNIETIDNNDKDRKMSQTSNNSYNNSNSNNNTNTNTNSNTNTNTNTNTNININTNTNTNTNILSAKNLMSVHNLYPLPQLKTKLSNNDQKIKNIDSYYQYVNTPSNYNNNNDRFNFTDKMVQSQKYIIHQNNQNNQNNSNNNQNSSIISNTNRNNLFKKFDQKQQQKALIFSNSSIKNNNNNNNNNNNISTTSSSNLISINNNINSNINNNNKYFKTQKSQHFSINNNQQQNTITITNYNINNSASTQNFNYRPFAKSQYRSPQKKI